MLVLEGGFTRFDRFIESGTRLLTGQERESLGQYVARGSISLAMISYDEARDEVVWKAAGKEFYKGREERFTGYEFMERLVTHIPPGRVQQIRRYGIYASRSRAGNVM